MPASELLEELLDLADRLGVQVRRADLYGQTAGLCTLRGQQVLFVDESSPLADQVASCAQSLADIAGVDEVYVRPEVRDLLDQYSQTGD